MSMKLRDYSTREIEIYGERHGILAFGAGGTLMSFMEPRKKVASLLVGILDNNHNKDGTHVCLHGRDIPVYDFKKILRWGGERPLVIITNTDEYASFEQMESYEELEEVDCCCHYIVTDKDREERESSRIYPKCVHNYGIDKIPKKIHYCWFGRGKMTEIARNCIRSWKRFCPEYEIIRWDENNYDFEKNRYAREAYLKGKWAFVSDVARLDIIFAEGGIYFDTDVELIKSPDFLLRNECFFALESDRFIATGLGFGAVPESQTIDRLRSVYAGRRFINDDGSMDETSCPVLQEKFFIDSGYPQNGNYYEGSGFVIYPRGMFSPKSFSTGRISIREETVSIHHFEMSWHAGEFRERMQRQYELARRAIEI